MITRNDVSVPRLLAEIVARMGGLDWLPKQWADWLPTRLHQAHWFLNASYIHVFRKYQ